MGCTGSFCGTDAEPMEMPQGNAGLQIRDNHPRSSTVNFRSSATAAGLSSSGGLAMPVRSGGGGGRGDMQSPNPVLVQESPAPTRSNFLLGLGSQTGPSPFQADHGCSDASDERHNLHCRRSRAVLHNRQMDMLAHNQRLVFVPHYHLHNLPLPYAHYFHRMQNPHSYPQNPLLNHHPTRRSAQYHGQGYIVAHHNHHHHVNIQ